MLGISMNIGKWCSFKK